MSPHNAVDPIAFNEQISFDKYTKSRNTAHLLQRGLNFASFYGNGNVVEVTHFKIDDHLEVISFGLQITNHKLQVQ